ncbi:hypothetical protein [Leptolyngbya ohadii]|uniref:hypothetical protein n=1 Tax=Leptolyngbya ohadii TaxID=1962290 RepID=UPI000B59A65E|nr:hypothetical protein [Leptolyngbya ohadii]
MVFNRPLNQAGFAAALMATTVLGTLFATPVPQNAQAAEPILLTAVNARIDRTGEPIGINKEAILGLALAGSVAIGMGMTVMHRMTHPNWANENLEPIGRRNRKSGKHPSGSQFHSANPRLQQRLIRLLHDDRDAASRLVAQAQLRYPGQSPNWYVEKVIYDLQRDHGRV